MKKGQVIEGIVSKVTFPNKGIVGCEEGQVEVKGVLPGQKVEVMVQKVRHGRAEGRLLSVLERAPYEIEAQCLHAAECGGCSYQTMPYEEQLKLKEQQVLELMKPVMEKQKRLERSAENDGDRTNDGGDAEGTVRGLEGTFADMNVDGVVRGVDGTFADMDADEVVSRDGEAAVGTDRVVCGAEDNINQRGCGRETHTLDFPEYEGIRKSPRQFGYRNKMEFTFGDEYKDGPLSLGMHKKGSFYDIVPVMGCRIVDEDYRKILRTVMDFAREQKLSFYHRLRHEGYLRHLLVRKAARTGELLIAVITTTQGEHGEDLRELSERLLALSLDGKIVGIVHTSNDSLADVVQSDATETLYGQDCFYEELSGLRFRISEFSFFQTNSLGAEVLYETAREFIGEIHTVHGRKPVIYDLYSGTGTIAQMMAPVAEQVIGVEIVEEAVLAARENAALNDLHNCKFIAGDVLKVLDEIEVQPDFIILDPPRDGIHPKALKKIIDYGVERLIYISCKPTSFARDLEVFLDMGYRVERMCCVDMFPGTVHVETVVQLSLKKDTPKIEVTMEPGAESNYTPEEKATYGKIKAYVKEKHGLNVSNLYIAQIKDKCGLDKRDNYNLPKSEDAKVPKCPPEKEAAIMDALRHFNMI